MKLFGTTLAFLALSFLNSTYGFQASNRAVAMARGGINDAMLQLTRNKDFESAGYCLPYSGEDPCPLGYARIIVAQDDPSEGRVTVTSEASFLRYRRQIRAVFSVNASTSLVRLLSAEQVQF